MNNGAEETMASVDTNNTVLELSESPTNTKDASNDNNKDNNAKSKERDNTNDIGNKNNDGTEEIMAITIALTQDSGERKNITSDKNKKCNDDALDDTDSGNEDEEVGKTGNDNVGKRLRRKGICKK